jgi:hypothetical protein
MKKNENYFFRNLSDKYNFFESIGFSLRKKLVYKSYLKVLF